MKFKPLKLFALIFFLFPIFIFPKDLNEKNKNEQEEPSLSINEPMYFILGKNKGDIKARLQFSFKYKLFDSDGVVVKRFPFFSKFHFGYTQNSLWNISGSSSPFEDSSYRPSLFWEFKNNSKDLSPFYLRAGYEHESNGQSGYISRSIDTIFSLLLWEMDIKENILIFGIKPYFYIFKGRYTKDIEDYRGYSDFLIRYGNEDKWILLFLYRRGTENKNTFQFDLSYPIRKRIFSRAGGYFYIQVFYGYGETLIKYDKKEGPNLRAGFAIVR